MGKIVTLTPGYMKKAAKALAGLSKEQAVDLAMYFTGQFIEEIEKGLTGEIDYEDSPVFQRVDEMYEEAAAPPSGCYFCDRTIDGNGEIFDYPEKTKVCLTCMLKVANVLKAFGIDPKCIFPGVGDRKKQPVLYEVLQVKKPEGEIVH